jgi:hypothetical protein
MSSSGKRPAKKKAAGKSAKKKSAKRPAKKKAAGKSAKKKAAYRDWPPPPRPKR